MFLFLLSRRDYASDRGRASRRVSLGVLALAKAAVVGVALVLALAGCGGGSGGSGDELSGTVRVDGSSTVFPITEAVAEEFMNEHPRVRVAVSKSGTGGGFAKFLRGETAINDASRPISAGEQSSAENQGQQFIELPVAYDGLAVVANPQNDWAECLTTEELRAIWEPGSSVTSWSDVRPSFPDRPVELYGPGTASGTFDYFTEAIVGESGQSRTNYNASEDDNVLVQGVEGDPGALGFFGLAYYENNAQNLKLLGVDGGESPRGGTGGCVKPSTQTVSNGSYQPLSRPLFIYVNEAQSSNAATEAFVEFYLQNVGDLATEVGYVPLTGREYELALQRFQNRTTGTMYGEEGGGASSSGMSLEERLRGGAATPADSAATPSDTSATATAGRE